MVTLSTIGTRVAEIRQIEGHSASVYEIYNERLMGPLVPQISEDVKLIALIRIESISSLSREALTKIGAIYRRETYPTSKLEGDFSDALRITQKELKPPIEPIIYIRLDEKIMAVVYFILQEIGFVNLETHKPIAVVKVTSSMEPSNLEVCLVGDLEKQTVKFFQFLKPYQSVEQMIEIAKKTYQDRSKHHFLDIK